MSPAPPSPTTTSRACSRPAASIPSRPGRVVLHSLPIGYTLDGVRGIGDPRGMLAREFGVDMHVVTADVAAARNLMLTVERCHLSVETMVAAPMWRA